MVNSRQLRWAQYNAGGDGEAPLEPGQEPPAGAYRRRGDRRKTQVVGELVEGVLGVLRRRSAFDQALYDLLSVQFGDVLLSQATPAGVQRGVLMMNASNAGAAYQLGLQWEQRILEVIWARLPHSGITGVRFRAVADAGA